jgi:hypothetical protein
MFSKYEDMLGLTKKEILEKIYNSVEITEVDEKVIEYIFNNDLFDFKIKVVGGMIYFNNRMKPISVQDFLKIFLESLKKNRNL